ncbi:S8 family serine peptidase [Amycolatopsis acidiphila]|uniref:S8 family serine peptidase n=1 Tax=Amycolatopsis acidiphila TaxID=715473 RepID=A0A558A3N8_9PSEU|nr:S8 family serine peptidase [Amycolatopsis acidiphila]TVT18846.1 S8 family serine peptidase [Amycolatopsis acidiphila]UIJ61767.1 S8 family serine peptidase [Amycolatopsis acidiphila]GHG57984.1 serine protease [Amycolatopsis acidiphila]
MSGFGRSLTLGTCAALLAAAPFPVAAADQPDPGCGDTGRTVRYLVVFDRGTPETQADRQVGAACGQSAIYYPQISVGVVTSTDPGFAAKFGPDRAFSAQEVRRPVTQRRAEVSSATVPGVDRTDEQWDMAAVDAIGGTGSPDVVVGVLDSGVDPAHPDLAQAIDRNDSAGCLSGVPDRAANAWQPTTSAHGTHVAGLIAAADDGKGITGVAPRVRVASVKVIDDDGYVDPEAAVCGLMWAAGRHLPVVNTSFSVDPWGVSCARREGYPVVHEAIARAEEYATAQGTLDIAAATNESVNLTPSPRSGVSPTPSSCEELPAGLRDAVTVSAVGRDGVKAGYSSYGLGVVDLAAPGGARGDCVLSTVPGGYASMCGTSMAAPHAAGVAALVASAHQGLSARQLRAALFQGARPMPCPTDYDLTGDGHQDAFCTGYTGYNGFYGHGMVDAAGALDAVSAAAGG